MGLQIFQRAADEVAHVDERRLGQVVHLLHGGFRRGSGGRRDVLQAAGARDIDAAVDRMNPRRARIGNDDAGGAEDRQAADNAEAPVQRLLRERRAVRNGDLHLDVARVAVRGGDLGDRRADHLARHGIDGGLAGRDGKAGPRHRAHALARAERDAAPGRAGPYRREDQRAVGHVGIVARVLDHAGRRHAVAARRGGEGEGRPLAARQRDLDRIGERPGEQRGIGRLGSGRGASPGRPAPAERAGGLVHAFRYRTPRAARHGRSAS